MVDLELEPEKCALSLCGSRGVGAVTIQTAGGTAIELLDLEEDEYDDEDDEDSEQ